MALLCAMEGVWNCSIWTKLYFWDFKSGQFAKEWNPEALRHTMCSTTLANTCEYIYFQPSQTHPQKLRFWNTSEMIICWHDKNMIQIVKQQEKFCMLACHTLAPEKFMVPQDLQVESQDIPVLNMVPGMGGCTFPERCWNLYKPLKCFFLKKNKKPHSYKKANPILHISPLTQWDLLIWRFQPSRKL